MRNILERYFYDEFKICDTLGDFELSLWPGEIWLTTEPVKMRWFEAIEIAANHSHIRLPDYSDLIKAEESCRKKPQLRQKFAPLEEGEFWTIGSERFDPMCRYACCVVSSHDRYESHHSKFDKKWVRFIIRGSAETPETVTRKNEERLKYMYEENLRMKTEKILGADTPQGRKELLHDLKMYNEFAKADNR
jgi:hypothetical protein